jgi:small glutamine-rich tetratricopeptide repeat-containing protein alpha
MNDHSKAIDDAKKASEIDPTFAKAYSRLGHALFSSGKHAEAVSAYEKGVELDPTVSESFLSLWIEVTYLSIRTK